MLLCDGIRKELGLKEEGHVRPHRSSSAHMMSSTATHLQATQRIVSLTSRNMLWIRLSVQMVFGCVFLVGSLFFVLSYATFDFFGARNSPFFAWLRQLSFILRILYFPALISALLCCGAGEVGGKGDPAKRFAFWGVVIQLSAAGILILLQARVGLYGWALLFGPSLQSVIGYVDPYTQAVAGLIPLAWISAIYVLTSFRSASNQTISNSLRLRSFLMAGLTVSVLYMVAARMRWNTSDQPFTLSVLVFTMATQLAIFVLLFLVLQAIRLAAGRFPDPGLAQLALRAVVAWIVLGILMRRIIFALLSFNDHHADAYAALFSLTVVLFTLGLMLKIKEQVWTNGRTEAVARPRYLRVSAVCALVFAAAFFYIFAIKFAAVDWEHVLSSVAALVISSLVLWFFLAIRGPARNYSVPVVAALALVAVGCLVTLQMASSKEPLAGSLEQFSDYDPSFFAVQQALKPMVQEDSYSAWYAFLAHHANIRLPVQAPDVPLTERLQPTTFKKPNIFVFVIDALRRDYVSAYNPSVTFTPGFGAFAKENVVFQHAYSQYAGTDLAVTAMVSGIQQLNMTFPAPVTRFNRLQAMLNVDGYDCYTSYNPIVAQLATKADRITNLSADLPIDDQQDFQSIIKKLESVILTRANHDHPIFVYSQPANVHTLSLTWRRGHVEIKPHPGFDDAYASSVERVDATFTEFIVFLKKEGLYDNSIVIVTADHGESLGELGRQSHTNNLTPEVIQIPLMIHLPRHDRSELTWDADQIVSLHDITPTLYYLLGHRPLRQGEMIGHSLFAAPGDRLEPQKADHYFLMSSYLPVFGVLSSDQKELFFVDAVLHRSFYYDLEHDPHAFRKRMTLPIRDHFNAIIRQDLEAIDKFYRVKEDQLAQSPP